MISISTSSFLGANSKSSIAGKMSVFIFNFKRDGPIF